ncbi:glycosyltransferase [Reichenbachiella ulvae]|uniref:Glycosyltransferase n=1 Tax=Reichenbachiella ulvae TaxID=2980104 RepID=A0ABT3CT68_9BACT|nr:glycosyltransferase [Reichenbachiella ulvae]MCV9386797.1 glycosyltransferase [Reichenbachiella ulvae]
MTVLVYLSLLWCVTSLLIYLLVLVSKSSKKVALSDEWPNVSILISLRNEEENVQRLCEQLVQLDYPKEKLEILIGDDDSQDQTLKVLREYETENFKVFSYANEQTGHFGKQKVLKSLYQKSKGEVLLFTDGDMVLQPGWVKAMLPGTDVLKVGVTAVALRGIGSALQNLDWLINEFMIKWLSEKRIYLTAWGNNMAVRRTWLQKVEYESLPESEVEDIALSQAMVQAGARIEITSESSARLWTKPVGLKRILHQRLRWMKGVKRVPIWIYGAMALRLGFLPMVMLLTAFHWQFVFLIVVKMVFHLWFLLKADGRKLNFWSFLSICFYDVYEILLYFSSFVAHVLRVQFDWKGRVYR